MDGKNKEVFLPMRKAAQISGLHPNTLRKYAKEGTVEHYTTPSGLRRFSLSSLQALRNSSDVNKEVTQVGKQSFLYARVSSKKQHDDLLRQIEFLRTKHPSYASYTLVQDIASGINFQRKGLRILLDACLQGTIGEVVVAHRDRLARFGFEILQYIIEKAGGKLTVLEASKHTSSEQELSEDLLSIVHVYCCRRMGKRSYKVKNTDESNQNQTQDEQGEETIIPTMDVH